MHEAERRNYDGIDSSVFSAAVRVVETMSNPNRWILDVYKIG